MERSAIKVVITGLGGGSFAEQCMQALRLSKIKYEIIGTDINFLSAGLYVCDRSYIVPSAKSKNYISRILDICKKEKPLVLIPGSEPELIKISEHKDKFEGMGVKVLMNNRKVIEICTNKWNTHNFLISNGFKSPATFIIDLNKKEMNFNWHYPVILKPYLASGGSKNIFIARDEEEFAFFSKYLNKQNISIIVQEYVGSAEAEYTIGVLSDEKENIIGSMAMKRIIKSSLSRSFSLKSFDNLDEYIISSGISQGRIDDYSDIRKNAEMIAKKIRSTGPLNIQCRVTDRGIFVFEINPRFSGTGSIRALCGFNEPDILIRKYVLKESIRKNSCKKGVVLRGLRNYYISDKRRNILNKNKFIKNT